MSRRTKDQRNRDTLLAKVPDGAARIFVETELGEKKYKERHELADTDVIQTNKHGAPIVMQAKPGRKKTPELEPATAAVAELLKRKGEQLSDDDILRLAREDPESPELLAQVIVGLGEEAASIKFEREEAERKGKETSNVSVRRINALKATADTWLKRKEQLAAQGVDLDSVAFKAVFQHIVKTMKEAMTGGGMRPEAVEAIFAKFSGIVDSPEWEAEVKNIIKGVAR